MRVVFVCLFLMVPRVAHAQVELVIDAVVKEFELCVNPATQATLKFDSNVKQFVHHKWGDRKEFYVERGPADTITLRPGRKIDGQWGTLNVDLKNGRKAVFRVVGVLDPMLAPAVFHIRTAEIRGVDDAAVAQGIQGQCGSDTLAQLRAEIDTLKAENDALTTKNEALTAQFAAQKEQHERERADWKRRETAMINTRAERTILGELIEGHKSVPLPNHVPAEPGVTLTWQRWGKLGHRRIAFYVAENRSLRPYHVGQFQILDQQGINDHAGANVIGDVMNPPAEGVLAIIPPRTRMQGIIRVLDPEKVGTHVTFAMSEPGGKRPVTSERTETWDLSPLLEEPPDANVGKVTVSVMGTYGAIWIDDATPNTEELDETDIKVFGARVSYGLHRLFNVEAEGAYASTGQARFDDGVRSAKLGRVLFGGVLRLGTEWIPFLRGGAGLQVANYNGVGDGFEVNPLWHFGAGIERRLGPCAVGVGASLVGAIYGQSRSVDAGLHFGCGWKPGKDDD